MSKIELHKPNIKYKNSFLAGFAELDNHSDRLAWLYLGDNGDLNFPTRDFENFVQTLLKKETEAAQGFVCSHVYWAILNNEVVGRISLRHELTEFLMNVGGHIGYITRPSARGKGVASEMLRLVLQTDMAKKIGRLLVTCDPNNVASEKSIIKNGGIYENTYTEPNGEQTKRFWITI